MTAGAAQLFISYRRDDTAGYARALNELLAQQFGADRVFIDVDDIHAGQPFDQVIAQALGGASVLLVLIGPRWLAPQADGLPRLHRADDFVHRELAAGLAGGLQLIPLLFDGAAMPSDVQLPAPLRPLAKRQALVVDARRFAADTTQLLALLRPTMGLPAAAGGRRGWLLGAGVLALLGAEAGAWWAARPALAPPGAAAPALGQQRASVNGRWQAEVEYDWPGANFREQFLLQGEAATLTGTASFLQVPRSILDGRVDGSSIQFSTQHSEQLGTAERLVTQRYRGSLVADVLQLTMTTEGAAQPHPPVQVIARRLPAQP